MSSESITAEDLRPYLTNRRVLREPAEKHGAVVCPECGRTLSSTTGGGEVCVPLGQLVDVDVASSVDTTQLPTHGWVCTRHPEYAVVCPTRTEKLPDGWIGVLVEFADGHAREVPVPRQEVPADAR